MRGKGSGRRTPRRFRATGAVTPQRALVGAMAVSLLLTALILPPPATTVAPDQLVPVIVRGLNGSVDVAERLVLDAGGGADDAPSALSSGAWASTLWGD